LTIIDRVQIATGIPGWEPLSDTDQDALFSVWSDARWRVERVSDGWEVEIRTLSDRRIFGGADLERTLADAMRWLGRAG